MTERQQSIELVQILQDMRQEQRSMNEKLESLGREMSEFQGRFSGLLDNGQPGIITRLAARVERLERFRYWVVGIWAGVTGLVTYWRHG